MSHNIFNQKSHTQTGVWCPGEPSGVATVALSKTSRLLSEAAKRCRWQTVGGILDGLQERLSGFSNVGTHHL